MSSLTILAHRLSTGLFSGMALSVSLMGVPALRKTSDPLPAWKAYYEGGAVFAVTTVLTTIGSGAYNFYQTGNPMYILSTGLHFLIIPITAIGMGPGIKKLYTLDSKKDDKEIRNQIESWAKLHWLRIFVGTAAFVTVLLSDQNCLANCKKW